MESFRISNAEAIRWGKPFLNAFIFWHSGRITPCVPAFLFPCPFCEVQAERKGIMKFRKTNYNDRTTFTYEFATGEKVTFAPGDADGEVTAELIKFLHSQDDAEVYNNRKNCKPPLSDEEKEIIREWEKTHPGEEVSKNWTLSLDAFSEDADSDMDRSGLMREIYNRSHAENPAISRLGEVIDEMPYKQRQAFALVELDGYSMTEAADKLGCSIANVSKLVTRAKAFILEKY